MQQQQQQQQPPQSQPQQRTYPQAIMSTAPRNQAQSGDFGAAPFLPPPPARTGRPGQPQQMQMHQQQQQFGSSMAGFATMPRAPQQQNGPMGSMAAATGLPGGGGGAFPANFSNNGEQFTKLSGNFRYFGLQQMPTYMPPRTILFQMHFRPCLRPRSLHSSSSRRPRWPGPEPDLQRREDLTVFQDSSPSNRPPRPRPSSQAQPEQP